MSTSNKSSSNKFINICYNKIIAIIIPAVIVQIAAIGRLSRVDTFMTDAIIYTLIITTLSFAIIHLSSYINKNRWTIASVFMVGGIITTASWLAISFYCHLFNDYRITYSENLQFYFVKSYAIGTISTTMVYFWIKIQYQNADLQEKEKEIKKITIQMQKQNMPESKLITLRGDSKDSLTVLSQDLLYIESSGNYVIVHYLLNGKMLEKRLRTTLRQMEELLMAITSFVRSHSGFIINTYYIEEIAVDSLTLNFEEIQTQIQIPISRAYKAKVQEQMNAIGVFD